jgi:hydroxyacylglutathione hydrolase
LPEEIEIVTIPGKGPSSNINVVRRGSGAGSRSAIIVDTGLPRDRERILIEIKQRLGPCQVKCIVLTHMHYDHSANAAFFSRELTCPVLCHENGARSMGEGDSYTTMAFGFGEEIEPIECKALSDGGTVDLDGNVLQVIHTPGHTFDSICLYEGKSRTMISGDLVFAGFGMGRTDLPTAEGGVILKSIRRIMNYPMARILPGHGPPIEGDCTSFLERLLEGIA